MARSPSSDWPQILVATIRDFDQADRLGGIVPIWQVRAACCPPLDREAFDRLLRQLERDLVLDLRPHNRPASLDSTRRSGAIEDDHRGCLFYVALRLPR
jgi:hypothetical protein